eukprot:3333422-Pyramimonas_sp.AAC.1
MIRTIGADGGVGSERAAKRLPSTGCRRWRSAEWARHAPGHKSRGGEWPTWTRDRALACTCP